MGRWLCGYIGYAASWIKERGIFTCYAATWPCSRETTDSRCALSGRISAVIFQYNLLLKKELLLECLPLSSVDRLTITPEIITAFSIPLEFPYRLNGENIVDCKRCHLQCVC